MRSLGCQTLASWESPTATYYPKHDISIIAGANMWEAIVHMGEWNVTIVMPC
jgi:hypothetical protein